METARFEGYRVIASGGGRKLEDWAGVKLLRPDPQAIWRPASDLAAYSGLHAEYMRSGTGGGEWRIIRPVPEKWSLAWTYGNVRLRFKLKLMGFKHTGLFPEQAVNWRRIIDLIGARRTVPPVRVLNLFAYTGGATLAALAAGAEVCHVDASRGMTAIAGENADLSGLDRRGLRLIVDDCFQFVAREQRRGRRYDAVIMDPPAFGRGPGGEVWKLEENLPDLLNECARLLSDKPLFFLLNGYTSGLQPSVLANLLNIACREHGGARGGAESYELVLPTAERGIVLPCGATGIYIF
jgi:23S rRNA (cytosine1962-C5)-methyltransferase